MIRERRERVVGFRRRKTNSPLAPFFATKIGFLGVHRFSKMRGTS
jgi:hypothetical protein